MIKFVKRFVEQAEPGDVIVGLAMFIAAIAITGLLVTLIVGLIFPTFSTCLDSLNADDYWLKEKMDACRMLFGDKK